MIKRKLNKADWFLIIVNLLPIYGVWFLNWDPAQVFLVYCLETIIIGVFTLLKLGIATIVRHRDWWENDGSKTMVHGSFFMLFFLIHYGLFVAIQTSIFLGVSSLGHNHMPGFGQLLTNPFAYLGKDLLLVLGLFVVGYGYDSLSGFIFHKEYRTKSFARIMFEPYLRIFIQQFTVIAGSFFLGFGAGKIFILIFACVKIFFTAFFNYDKSLDKAETGNSVRQKLKTEK